MAWSTLSGGQGGDAQATSFARAFGRPSQPYLHLCNTPLLQSENSLAQVEDLWYCGCAFVALVSPLES
ncbi:MAG: hypothetical protein NVS9B4_10360 [Candidatus Acidiferrum sp.]